MDARREKRLRRLESRVRAILKDETQLSLPIFVREHPITWNLIFERLSEEEREAVRAITASQAMPNQDP